MNKNIKNIVIGFIIMLVVFITISFIFQDTVLQQELITNDDGEQILVELETHNFFAKVVNILKGIFGGSGFTVTMSNPTPEVGESFKTTFSGKIDNWCKPTSGLVSLDKGNSYSTIYSWLVKTTLPNIGDSYSYSVTHTLENSGEDFRFSHVIFGDVEYPYFNSYQDCFVPPTTEKKFCDAMIDNENCYSTDLSKCLDNIDSYGQLRCVVEYKYFDVVEPVTTCPSNYCENWERVGSISGGDEYEKECVTYSSAPTCQKYTDIDSKIICDSGYENDGNRCIEIIDEIDCFRCVDNDVEERTFEDSCDSGWTTYEPDCSVDVVCYSCDDERLISNTFKDECKVGWTETEPNCEVVVPNTVTCYACNGETGITQTFSEEIGCTGYWSEKQPNCIGEEEEFKFSDLFDYENHPVESYSTLGVLAILIISLIVFIPFGKGGKK